ncbi:hypothetical protein A4A49_25163 [Nicotiana attenuata]|uniref:Pectinesterase inhibitor domain-containing protein n=1 Tax=Nicotiana attenuata TaxID=49451 RepID=A0A314LG48_NICAT|nr:hypothetical protein A4A49_25163 [Nicotiana attenuata]
MKGSLHHITPFSPSLSHQKKMAKLIFLIFLCVTTLANLATSQTPLVSNFCHRAVFVENFCLKVLGSDNRSKTAKTDHDLEGITIDLGSKTVRAVINKAISLSQSAKDPNVKAAISSCLQDYNLLSLDFSSIKAAFQSGGTIGQQGADARLAVSKCNQAFGDKKLPNPLSGDNDNLLSIIQVILVNGV